MTHFWRPVKKANPVDNMWRAGARSRRVVAKEVSIGNKPVGAHFTAVSHEFVVIEPRKERR